MTRVTRLLLTLLLACITPQPRAQYDPDAPSPIAPLGGSLVLASGVPQPATLDRFIELAGGDGAQVVVLATHDGSDPLGGRGDATRLAASSRPARLDRFTEALSRATGVWLAGDDPGRFLDIYGGTAIEGELRSLIGRGGVVGASGKMVTALTARRRGSDQGGLDLLPGSVVEVGFPNAQGALIEFLRTQPSLVGFGLEEDTVMVLEQRSIRVLAGALYTCIADSPTRPLDIHRLGPRQRGDLLALSRAATARTLVPFPPDVPPDPGLEHGALVILGGGALPPGLLQRFIELCGGPDAKIVYVPCTPAEVIPKEPRMVQAFRNAGARNITWVHTADRVKANQDEAILGPLGEARGIWFGGGRQWNLVDSYANTTAHRLMHEVLARGGAIGGSSSGASILADYLARGHPVSNRPVMAEGYERGLGFLTGTAIDQHITQRNRLGDLRSLKNTYPQLLAIGLDEGTALVVQGSVAEVYALPGRQAFFFDGDQPAEEDDHTVLASGLSFDLAARQLLAVKANPLPAPGDMVGTWGLRWMTTSGPRTATLRLDLELEGTLSLGEDRFPLGELIMEGRTVIFTVRGFPGRLEFEGAREGGTLQGILSVDGYKVADFQGTKLDDGPSEYFDDARPARRR